MPLAGYRTPSAYVNQKDFIPDPNKVGVITDPSTKTFSYYRYVQIPDPMDPNPNIEARRKIWKRKVFEVKTLEELPDRDDRQKFSLPPDERKKLVLSRMKSAGMQIDVGEDIEDFKLRCRCGFSTYDQKEIFKHKSACTYVIDEARRKSLEAQQKAIEEQQKTVAVAEKPVPQTKTKAGKPKKS